MNLSLFNIFQYGTKRNGDKSGAYLFMPDGEAQVVKPVSPLVRIVEGKVLSYVEVLLPWAKHTVTLKSSPGNYNLNISNIKTFSIIIIDWKIPSTVKESLQLLYQIPKAKRVSIIVAELLNFE